MRQSSSTPLHSVFKLLFSTAVNTTASHHLISHSNKNAVDFFPDIVKHLRIWSFYNHDLNELSVVYFRFMRMCRSIRVVVVRLLTVCSVMLVYVRLRVFTHICVTVTHLHFICHKCSHEKIQCLSVLLFISLLFSICFSIYFLSSLSCLSCLLSLLSLLSPVTSLSSLSSLS